MSTRATGPAIRTKLTLLYGALFLLSGLLLIAITYGLVRRELNSLPASPPDRATEVLGDRDEDDDADEDDDDDPDVREIFARREERQNALRQLWRQSFLALLITGGATVFLGWLVAGRVLGPIRRITEHAQQASVATLGDRIALEGPADELKDLADTFDAMLDRLQAAFESRRVFAAQASHELRTPLTVIRAEAEIALSRPELTADVRSSFEAVLTAVNRSERLIDGLLALSRSESSMLEPAVVDMASLVGDVVASFASEADSAEVRLELDLGDGWISGDAPLLERLVGNLVQNGIRYNQRGGSVDVSIQTDGAWASLIVANTGPAVAQSDIDTLFKPFARGSWAQRNRGGHGLGLAIVQSVAAVHGGTVQARPGDAGGLVVEVRLPAVQPSRG